MRALKRDIVEIFGFAPNDRSPAASHYWTTKNCPFTNHQCTKTNHDNSLIYGICSASNGIQRSADQDIIICPNRLYADNYSTIRAVAHEVWGHLNPEVIIGGTIAQLKSLLQRSTSNNIIVAFGTNSGREIAVNSNGRMKMDWVLQRYTKQSYYIQPEDFVGIEVQSIDISGNYRDTHEAYTSFSLGNTVSSIPDSRHGLNWANVHKRLIPQIIRKGNIYQESSRCIGFYFILPDIVYKKFEEVLGNVPRVSCRSKNVLSVMTYSLAEESRAGVHRKLNHVRTVHHRLSDIKEAFSHNTGSEAPTLLDNLLSSIMN
jgi:hypothetical protein